MNSEPFDGFMKEFDDRIAEEVGLGLGNGEDMTKESRNQFDEDGGYRECFYSIPEGDGWTTHVTIKGFTDRVEVFVCLDGTPLSQGADIPIENISSGESAKVIDAVMKIVKAFGLLARLVDEEFEVLNQFAGISEGFSKLEKK